MNCTTSFHDTVSTWWASTSTTNQSCRLRLRAASRACLRISQLSVEVSITCVGSICGTPTTG
jgi:hypothetical protein